MLILAGISITMLSGDNGILTRAGQARDNSDNSQIEERIKLAELAARIDGYGNLSYSKLNEELAKEFGAKGVGYDISEETENPWEITVNNVVYEINHESNNVKQTLYSQISVANYGDLVRYMDVNGNSNDADWKVFYKDENYVYIIAKNCLNWSNVTTKPTDVGLSWNQYTSNAVWCDSYAQDVTGDSDIEKSNLSYTLNNENLNSRMTANLLKKGYWSEFVRTDYAEYAIGGPTIEMWVNSWNAKNTINPTDYQKLKIEKNTIGYSIGLDQEECSSYITLNSTGNENNKTGSYDELYFSKSEMSYSISYYLASPSSYYNTHGISASEIADETGRIGNCRISYDSYGANNVGVRPLICLKSDIIGESETFDGITTWTLSLAE